MSKEIKVVKKDGEAILLPNYYDDKMFQTLRKDIHWRQNNIRLFGKTYKEPRLTAWFGPTYKYSNILWVAKPMPDIISEMNESLRQKFSFDFNSVLCNYYRTGQDGMGWHRDNEPELDHRMIASVSFGCDRKFKFRHRESKEVINIILGSGSLLVMKNLQQHWEHSLPKSKLIKDGRINLTFRKIL